MTHRSISFLDDPNAAVEFAGLFLGHQLGRTMPYFGTRPTRVGSHPASTVYANPTSASFSR